MVRAPTRVAALEGQRIAQVSCGESHSLALSHSGQVFMWGLLPARHLVRHDAFDHASVSLAGMAQDSMAQEAMDPAALRGHMSDNIMARLLRDSMRVYEAADGTDGADGAEAKTQTIRRPEPTPRPSAALANVVITSIAAGFAHSLAVSAAGRVFSCGYNDNGQLGTGSRRNAADFQPVRALDEFAIARVACGQQHSLACARLDPLDPDKSGACFSWGLGVLGQLGSGINIAWLPMPVRVGAPVVSIAAGSHHSVAVTQEGAVYSWGHSEYGQHGGGELFDDLQRGAHYFFPRAQESLLRDEVAIDSVACSAHSTFALARDGRVFSWGWNAFGVLGHGKLRHSVNPQPVLGLKDNVATHVAAGSNHCAVCVAPRGAHYSLRLDLVLQRGDFADVEFVVGGGAAREKAHRAIVGARSAYLKGLMRATAAYTPTSSDKEEMLVIDDFADVDAAVFRALLVFLYTNRLEVPVHKKRALGELAQRVYCEDLAVECQDSWRQERRLGPALDASAPTHPFVTAMDAAVLSEELADVEFLWPATEEEDAERLPAHKAVLSQVDYFRTMFLGGFSEGSAAATSSSNNTNSSSADPEADENSSKRHAIPLHYMPRDGVSLAAFKGLLRWIYTGCFPLVSAGLGPVETMDLFVGASLLGLSALAGLCERELLALLDELDEDSLVACRDFAAQYDARRLLTRTSELLKQQDGAVDEGGEL